MGDDGAAQTSRHGLGSKFNMSLKISQNKTNSNQQGNHNQHHHIKNPPTNINKVVKTGRNNILVEQMTGRNDDQTPPSNINMVVKIGSKEVLAEKRAGR